MRDRVFGVETEYALVCRFSTASSIKELEGEELLNRMRGATATVLGSLDQLDSPAAGEFLGNGGRLYMDRGGHPEYATPECRSVLDLLTYEKAGDRLIHELFARIYGTGRHRNASAKPHLFKNNVDFYGNTYGSHENYLVTERAHQEIAAVIPFLVTRQIYAGSGKIAWNNASGEPAFRISQRADFFDLVYSDRTSEVRGIINTRRREIPQHGKNRRLHLILGDSNLSETAIALKIGTTHLVLRVLEEDSWKAFPSLRLPVEALKRISRDLTIPVELNGERGRWTAIEIQREYLDRVRQFFASRSPTEEENWILQLWEKILDGLKCLKLRENHRFLEDDPKGLYRQLDWVLKLWLISRYAPKDESLESALTSRKIDVLYHDLDPVSGLYQRCRKIGLVDRQLSDSAIDTAKIVPPGNTRAYLRGLIIRAAHQKDIDVIVDGWDKVILQARRKGSGIAHIFNRHRGAANNLVISLNDPFHAEDENIMATVTKFVDNWG